MKKHLCLLPCLAGLALNSAMGQPRPFPAMPGMPPDAIPAPRAAAPGLTKFNLDFPGGTPKELVAAISKASGHPLNAIVPDQFADLKLPALKMNGVDTAHLFSAMRAANVELRDIPFMASGSGRDPNTRAYGEGTGIPGMLVRMCFFQTTDPSPNDDSVWTFSVVENPTPSPALPAKICRFYSLSPYLERGLTVDDITTAIETGWKMLGDSPKPTISFHKETKLLIAVGEASKLETIDAVLKALAPAAAPPAEKPKTGK